MRASLAFLAVFVALIASSYGVNPRAGYGPGMQDWGYITVRPGAHTFYWLYYTTANVPRYEDRPLVIWLQGGPGASGVGYGNFAEIGPLDIHSNERNTTWVRNYNLLFIDNPVGTGWSFVESTNLLTKTNADIAADLVEFMRQFYAQNPEFVKSPLHIFSESYGGKMAAEFGYELHKEIQSGNINCDLVSVGLGNSWMSPIDSVLSWAPFLLQTGYVDVDGHDRINVTAMRTKAAVDEGRWEEATDLWGRTEVDVMRETDGLDFYNILTPIKKNRAAKRLQKFRDPRYIKQHMIELTQFAEENEDAILYALMNGAVKSALGVNRTWTMSSNPVFNAQKGDFMKPVVDIVPRVGYGPGLQDWGHITVRPGAHTFWWLYYTQARIAEIFERPLVIWLQGGPGASSTGYGNFAEIGPLDLKSRPRNSSWTRNYNVLFIDNPVGTGWSYVESSDLLTKTNAQIAADLVEFMRQFYKLNPEFETTPLHIFSESYGGKMAAEFGYELDKEIKSGNIKCNLVSVGLGNSWMSPIDSVMSWAPFLLQTGYVDVDGHDRIHASALATKVAVDTRQWSTATVLWGLTEEVVMRETDGLDFYNILTPIKKGQAAKRLAKFRDARYLKNHLNELNQFDVAEDDAMLDVLMNGPVKETLGINRTWTMSSGPVFNAQIGDFMKPVVDIVAKLLDETDVKVVVFTGLLDLIVATPGTVEWINAMPWSGLEAYKNNPRTSVVVDGYVEAYLRQEKNFYTYWVPRAGHMSPADNPKALDAVLKNIAGY